MTLNMLALIIIGVAIGIAIAVFVSWLIIGKRTKKGTEKLASSLQREKTKSDTIINSISDGVVLIDTASVIQLFNPGAMQITGWSANDAVGLDVHTVLKLLDSSEAEYDKANNPFDRALRESTIVKDNTGYLKGQKSRKVAIALTVTPLRNSSEKLIGAVGIIRDVTQERGEEQQRADFISTASHEMRTPVAAIEGYLALAMNDKVSKIDSKAKEYLEKAHASTQHLGKLFQDLLTAAKSEDGRLSNHPVVVEMCATLEQITEDLRFTAEKKGLQVEFVLGSENHKIDARTKSTQVVRPLYYTYVDPERIREVVTNLFDNAVKYTEQGKITVGITGNKDVVQLRVADTGEGISAYDIPHLFQKFYRVDNSATRTIGGTGLGLFICYKIVELYNGRIWVESNLGKGSAFFIDLPRLSGTQAFELQKQEQAATHGGTTTILPKPNHA